MNKTSAENYVNGIFSRATNELCKIIGSRNNTRGSLLHDTQVEYCYIVRNITSGADYIAPKFISKVESLVEKINAFNASIKDTRLNDTIEYPINGGTYSWDGGTYRRVYK